MPSLPASTILAVLLGLVLGLPFSHADDEKKTSSEKGSKEGEEAANATSGLVALARFIPLGQEQKSVRFPSYNGTKISSYIEAATMKRVDDQHLHLTEMTITTYDAKGLQEMVVTMPTALYDLDTGNLEGIDRSKVSREDFDVEGDHMLFDSVNSIGLMEGNVRMVIKDSESLSLGPNKKEAEAKALTPTPTPPGTTNEREE